MPPAMQYRVQNGSSIEWIDLYIDKDADDIDLERLKRKRELLMPTRSGTTGSRGPVAEKAILAKEQILSYLEDHPEGVPVHDINELILTDLGYSANTLNRALTLMNVKKYTDKKTGQRMIKLNNEQEVSDDIKIKKELETMLKDRPEGVAEYAINDRFLTDLGYTDSALKRALRLLDLKKYTDKKTGRKMIKLNNEQEDQENNFAPKVLVS